MQFFICRRLFHIIVLLEIGHPDQPDAVLAFVIEVSVTSLKIDYLVHLLFVEIHCVSDFYPVVLGRYAHQDLYVGLFDRLRRDQIAKLGVSRTFQNLRLFRDMTVLEHLAVAQSGNLPLGSQLLPRREQERRLRAEAMEILDFLGIAKWLHNKYRTNNNGI